jgi:hypothetical protein
MGVTNLILKRGGLAILFIIICVVGTLTTTFSKGIGMKAETFFKEPYISSYVLAQKGNVEHLKKLGIDLDRPGKDDMTLLGLAVLTADARAIVSLIGAGANPNQVIRNAGSPAILAITKHYNPPRTKAVEALLDAGYDPNQLLGQGKPYLFFFVDYKHWDGLKLALQRGGDVNARRENGKSLLIYLIEGGDYAKARELIEMGADVGARGVKNETALLAIESKVRTVDPSIQTVWKQVISLRQLILTKLPDPKDRRSAFTQEAEEKIRKNP